MICRVGDNVCGLFDRFKRKRINKGATEPGEVVEAIDEYTWEGLMDEIGYTGRMAYETDKGLIFHIQLTNKTDTPWGNVKLGIALSKEGILTPAERILRGEMINPQKTEIFKFYLEPSLKIGIVEILIYLSYYDFDRKDTVEIVLPIKKAKMKMPQITKERFKMEVIFDTDWRIVVSSMESVEVQSDVLLKKASTVFLDLEEKIRSLGIHAFKPEINPNIYRAIGRFWAKGNNNVKYGIHLEVIGKDDKTKALLIFYASDHMKLLPFASGVVSHIRKDPEYRRNL